MMNRLAPRRGITLLEVLISIFVLAVGLLSVAALIPAGRHEVSQATRIETASMIGRAAFRDLQIRGLLDPATWLNTQNEPVYDPFGKFAAAPGTIAEPFVRRPNSGPPERSKQVAVAIDPLGIAAILNASRTDTVFPIGATPSLGALVRVAPFTMNSATAAANADIIFRSSIDLISQPHATNPDLPPGQVWTLDSSKNPLRRASLGDYSWLATIVSDPTRSATAGNVIVSVAVFYKRDLSGPGAGESVHVANPPQQITPGPPNNTYLGASGGEFYLSGLTKPLLPGQWIMLAAQRFDNVTLTMQKFARWYRVVSTTRFEAGNQHVTLSGTTVFPSFIGNGLQAFVFDNVIAVYEKTMSLDTK